MVLPAVVVSNPEGVGGEHQEGLAVEGHGRTVQPLHLLSKFAA